MDTFSMRTHRESRSFSMARVPPLLLLVGATMLSGCLSGGGGGGDSGGSAASAGTTPAALVAITEANASDVSDEVLDALDSVSDSGDLGSVFVTAAAVAQEPRAVNLAALAEWQVRDLMSLGGAQVPVAATGAVTTTTVPCNTGSYSITMDNVNPGGTFPTNGDIAIVYDNCSYAAGGPVLDGALAVNGLTVSGDPSVPGSDWGFSATFDFDNLSSVYGSEAQLIDGSFGISMTVSENMVVTTSITGTSLTITRAGLPVTIRNYTFHFTADPATGGVVFTMDGEIEGVELGGRVLFESLADFSATGAADPYSGTIKITGQGGSSVTVIALDAVNVRMEIDRDGDGSTDVTTDTTWSELDV